MQHYADAKTQVVEDILARAPDESRSCLMAGAASAREPHANVTGKVQSLGRLRSVCSANDERALGPTIRGAENARAGQRSLE